MMDDESGTDTARLSAYLGSMFTGAILQKTFDALVAEGVDFDTLMLFTEEDLKELGILKGPRVKVIRNIQEWNRQNPEGPEGMAPVRPPPIAAPAALPTADVAGELLLELGRLGFTGDAARRGLANSVDGSVKGAIDWLHAELSRARSALEQGVPSPTCEMEGMGRPVPIPVANTHRRRPPTDGLPPTSPAADVVAPLARPGGPAAEPEPAAEPGPETERNLRANALYTEPTKQGYPAPSAAERAETERDLRVGALAKPFVPTPSIELANLEQQSQAGSRYSSRYKAELAKAVSEGLPWACAACTLSNACLADRCAVCGAAKRLGPVLKAVENQFNACFGELSPAQQNAALTLGWTWCAHRNCPLATVIPRMIRLNLRASPPRATWDQEGTITAVSRKQWKDLTREEVQSATILGYEQTTWGQQHSRPAAAADSNTSAVPVRTESFPALAPPSAAPAKPYERLYSELKKEQKDAVVLLGWSENSWGEAGVSVI